MGDQTSTIRAWAHEVEPRLWADAVATAVGQQRAALDAGDVAGAIRVIEDRLLPLLRGHDDVYEVVPLSDLATVSIDPDDADVWLRRSGGEADVGRVLPGRQAGAHIGIKLNARGRETFDPTFLRLYLEHLHDAGVWRPVARGTTRLTHLRVSDVASLVFRVRRAVHGPATGVAGG